jgi:hypothetical protein
VHFQATGIGTGNATYCPCQVATYQILWPIFATEPR